LVLNLTIQYHGPLPVELEVAGVEAFVEMTGYEINIKT
jgi:hypothetical protein